MRYTNINILDDTKRFKYIIEYKDNVEFQPSNMTYVNSTLTDSLRIDFFNSNSKLVRNNNYWLNCTQQSSTTYVPEKYNVSSVNLYFPQNSVESFTNNNLYILTVNTWIHGHIIYLGTYLIDRRDAIACNKEVNFLNTRYFEYVNVKFIDPWYLTYSDDWKEFRKNVCHENEEDTNLNNTGSVLNFTLYPVVWNDDRYIKLDPYIGGQNAINISDNVSDYIGCGIKLGPSSNPDHAGEIVVKSNITFNRIYNTDGVQTFEDFKEYMKETYDIEDTEDLYLKYNLLVVDTDNVYKLVTKTKCKELECEFTRDELSFGDWSGWKEGLQFILNVEIYLDSTPISTDYVDLGLPSGTLWCTHNIGATNENTIESWRGDFYRCCDIVPFYDRASKQEYDEYISGKTEEYEDPQDDTFYRIKPEYDPVTLLMGQEWRLPSKKNIDELCDFENTTVEYVTNYNGVTDLNGILFTSIHNGNTLFFPFGEQCGDNEEIYLDSADYWASNTDYNDVETTTGSLYIGVTYTHDEGAIGEAWFNSMPVDYYGGLYRAVKINNGTVNLDTSNSNTKNELEELMLLRSNTISITQDVMKYFIDNEEITDIPNYINLENINMNNYIINAVNKIEKKIIQIDKPNDNRSNLIKPVYYRVRELNNLIIHPAVTENICINLESYKSTVSTFYLQLENTVFVETARNSTGVIFKIIGSNLSNEVNEGTYYILNQDKELVTTGKYKYEQ